MTIAGSAVAPMRVSRGVAFAGAALVLAVGAHLAGGGGRPGLGALVFLTVPVAWISFFLTRARRAWPIVVTSLLVIEAGLHEGLTVLSGPAAPLQMVGHGPMMMGAHVQAITQTATALPSPAGMPSMGLVPSSAMVVAHLVATVLTGLVLAYGEHLLWCLWTWLHHAVTVSADLIQLPLPRSLTPRWLVTVSLVPVLVGRRVRRRGPPALWVGLPACA